MICKHFPDMKLELSCINFDALEIEKVKPEELELELVPQLNEILPTMTLMVRVIM